MATAGRALAALHTWTLPGLATHGPEDEIGFVERWVDLAETAGLDPAGALRSGIHEVAYALRSIGPVVTTLIHRDYYEKQLLLAESRTAR